MLFGAWIILAVLIAAWLMVEMRKGKIIQKGDDWGLALGCAFAVGAILSGMFIGMYWFASTFKSLFGIIALATLLGMFIKKAIDSKKSKK